MTLSKSILGLCLLFIFTLSSFAQNTEFKTTRYLTFEETSKTQTIDVKVTEDTIGLSLEILCNVSKGDVTISIYDPSQKKQGEFSVESIIKESKGSLFSKEGVTGEIRKSINDPEKGTWSIRFTPTTASGRVQINSYLMSK